MKKSATRHWQQSRQQLGGGGGRGHSVAPPPLSAIQWGCTMKPLSYNDAELCTPYGKILPSRSHKIVA